MLSGHPLIAFAATRTLERAREFYEGMLGLELVSEDPIALVFNAHGTMLRVQKVEKFQPQPFTTLGWSVPDIARTVRALSQKGIAFVRYDFLPQDELGIWKAPGGARVAWFRDPDGNLLSLTQLAITQ